MMHGQKNIKLDYSLTVGSGIDQRDTEYRALVPSNTEQMSVNH